VAAVPQRVQYDVTMRHGPVTAPISAFLAAVLTAVVWPWLHLPPWVPFVIAAVGAAVTIYIAFKRKHPRDVTVFRVACWLGAGAWPMWPLLGGWHLRVWMPALVLLLAATVGAALLSTAFGTVERTVVTADTDQPPAYRGVKGAWARDVDRACSVKNAADDGARVVEVTKWNNGAGFTISGEWAPGSLHSWEKVRDAARTLAAMRRLRRGCTLRVEQGDHEAAWLIHVTTRNELAVERPYPIDQVCRRSVRDPISIGYHADGRITYAELYQSAGIIGGQRGAGKTVLLQDFASGLVQCDDDLVWIVDLNGGGMAAGWAAAYVSGDVDRCAIDWIAADPVEALRVARAGMAIALDRKARYQRLMVQQNVDVLPVSAKLPAITIIVDEGGEVTGTDVDKIAKRAGAELRALQRVGRAMCVNVLFSVQRGTSTYVPTDMKKGAALTIMMRCKDDDEIAYMMDWSKLRSADLTHVGMAYIRYNQDSPEIFRNWRQLPAGITEISKIVEPWRPDLDAPAVAVADAPYEDDTDYDGTGTETKDGWFEYRDDYSTRWERLRPWLQSLAGVDHDDAPVSALAVKQRPPRQSAGGWENADPFAAFNGSPVPDSSDAPPPATATPAPVGQPTAGDDLDLDAAARAKLDAEMAELAGGWNLPPAVEPAAGSAVTEQPTSTAAPATGDAEPPTTGVEYVVWYVNHHGRSKTFEIVDAAKEAGLIVERRQTVSEWLGEAQRRGLLDGSEFGWWKPMAS
jgi:hypothetical protein